MTQRVALITGCGKITGIGVACARALSASGVAVVLASVANRQGTLGETSPSSGDRLAALAEAIRSSGGTASWVQGDVGDERDAPAMVEETLARHGRLDILVNNAGAPQGPDRAEIEEVPLSAWDEVMRINARGVFLMCRAVVPAMRRQRWGRIINISSSSAKVGTRLMAVYAASKAAVDGFTRSLALDLAPHGITVNSVCPYSIMTDRALNSARRAAGSADQAAVDAALADKAQRIPVGRHGRPDEVAAMVAYLASEHSGYVTGQAISICGGTT